MVGRVGIEPTVFLMCWIYSPMHSPAMHTYRYEVRLGPRLPAHCGLLTHYGVPPVAATYFATHLRLGGYDWIRTNFPEHSYSVTYPYKFLKGRRLCYPFNYSALKPY